MQTTETALPFDMWIDQIDNKPAGSVSPTRLEAKIAALFEALCFAGNEAGPQGKRGAPAALPVGTPATVQFCQGIVRDLCPDKVEKIVDGLIQEMGTEEFPSPTGLFADERARMFLAFRVGVEAMKQVVLERKFGVEME